MNPAGIVRIENGSFAENCWLVFDAASREAAIVDPGEEADRILAEVTRLRLDVKAIWLTHAHIDHIAGVDAVRRATGAPVWLHPADRRWYDILPEQGRMFGIDGLPRLDPPEHDLAHDDVVSVGSLEFTVRHVPGHAAGHVAFIGHGVAISGDVIFMDSIGRTDLAGGNLEQLMASIDREILPLDDDVRILPGHGPQTTVGRERRTNPFLAAR